jgi:RHS repeat-associated protein
MGVLILWVNGISIHDPTPYDGRVENGYEVGAFDGYALTVNVTDGLLTIAGGAGALDPKINFIEIGAAGTTASPALNTAVTAAAAQATQDTAKAKAKMPPTVKRNVWGSYVDELVSYTIKPPRKSPTRYFAHSNHLYSVAAITSATGSVVERWSYNAYGVPTIKNSANATIAKSAVGNDRGFTGYKSDAETGLYFARSRMYSRELGRFFSRDPLGDLERITRNFGFGPIGKVFQYFDGMSLYSAYFVPSSNDPLGLSKCSKSEVGNKKNDGPYDCSVACRDCKGNVTSYASGKKSSEYTCTEQIINIPAQPPYDYEDWYGNKIPVPATPARTEYNYYWALTNDGKCDAKCP